MAQRCGQRKVRLKFPVPFVNPTAFVRNSSAMYFPQGPSTNIMVALGFLCRELLIWFRPSTHDLSTWTLWFCGVLKGSGLKGKGVYLRHLGEPRLRSDEVLSSLSPLDQSPSGNSYCMVRFHGAVL